MAAYRIALGDVDGAREAAREGLRCAQQVQDAQLIAIALQHIALLLALRGEVYDAARLIGYVNAQFKELGNEREATEKWGYEKLMAALREQLSEAELEKLAAEGAAWSEDQAAEEALQGLTDWTREWPVRARDGRRQWAWHRRPERDAIFVLGVRGARTGRPGMASVTLSQGRAVNEALPVER